MQASPAPPSHPHKGLAESGVNSENYAHIEENPIKQVAQEPVSTFSIDVDTASYSNMRRILKGGEMLPKDAVRVEELINYFSYDYPQPKSKQSPLSVTAKTLPSPWNPETRLLHVGIKGFEIQPDQRPSANLVFLVDVSGSMASTEKLELVKKSFKFLVKVLRSDDRVSIIGYSDHTRVLLEPTPGDQTVRIMSVINRLEAGGSTNGSAGLEMAYDLARENYAADKLNRILIATDGDFNFGTTREKSLEDQVARERENSIFLSVLGYGRGNYNDAMMQTLSQAGNGIALYVDSLLEARKIFSNDLFANLFPIANDVKIQVEFNPAQVAEYRLVGYENRLLNREDFNNDKVDAGEIGSGHTVTAIYEYVPTQSKFRYIAPLRYPKAKTQPTKEGDLSEEVAFIRLRYKRLGEKVSHLMEKPVTPRDAIATFSTAPIDMQFAATVAGFGQWVRQSPYLKAFSLEDVSRLGQAAKGKDPYGYRAEFLSLIPLVKP
uniref:VWFA domain-containing protein n=1 Tax=Magnetococcus massalia (strain MO-1) TaxID=451514 RepID=A0A1S7LET3_MAGMO|nr:conserved protein of unknown function [include vWF_A, VWA and DUF3520 domain) [Candidatus Magnetococcus massalia]